MKCPKCGHDHSLIDLLKSGLHQAAEGQHLLIIEVSCYACFHRFAIKALLLEVN